MRGLCGVSRAPFEKKAIWGRYERCTGGIVMFRVGWIPKYFQGKKASCGRFKTGEQHGFCSLQTLGVPTNLLISQGAHPEATFCDALDWLEIIQRARLQ